MGRLRVESVLLMIMMMMMMLECGVRSSEFGVRVGVGVGAKGIRSPAGIQNAQAS